MSFLASKKTIWFLAAVLLLGIIAAGVLSRTTYPRWIYKRGQRIWLILTGHLVDVGGYRLRIDCYGSGPRTVVFDSGLNQPRQTWDKVTGEISKSARVCVYDRANVGESDRTDTMRTSSDVVRELRTLLENAGEKGPFIVVGHSFGGINARLFALSHSNEVSGLLLVDPSHEDQYLRMAELKEPAERAEYLEHEGGGNAEHVDLLESGNELRKFSQPLTVPTILLTASENMKTPMSEVSIDLNDRFTRSNPSVEHIPVENSGHFIQLDRPDAVIAAVNKLIK